MPFMCVCGHRRRDHAIEGWIPEVLWLQCEVCSCPQYTDPDRQPEPAHSDGGDDG